MERVTIEVESATHARLEDLARRRRVPTARVIREALERYVAGEATTGPREPLPDWVGMIEGPDGPWAELGEEVLAAGWALALEAERDQP